MATTTILTSKQHIPALYIDSEQRTLSFEFGGELTEFVYSIPADTVSMPQLLGAIQGGVDAGDFRPIVQGYMADGTLVADKDNPFEISEPMWLTVF